VDAPLGGVGAQLTIRSEAFAGLAENRQQKNGEGVQQKRPVAALGIADPKFAQ
jgi:hypothetical protein